MSDWSTNGHTSCFEDIMHHTLKTIGIVEAFGRTAPFRRISDAAVTRVSTILGEDRPSPFKNPEVFVIRSKLDREE
jgi:hypothetical protein